MLERVGDRDERVVVVEREGLRHVEAVPSPPGGCRFHPAGTLIYKDFGDEVIYFMRRLETTSDFEEQDALDRSGKVDSDDRFDCTAPKRLAGPGFACEERWPRFLGRSSRVLERRHESSRLPSWDDRPTWSADADVPYAIGALFVPPSLTPSSAMRSTPNISLGLSSADTPAVRQSAVRRGRVRGGGHSGHRFRRAAAGCH